MDIRLMADDAELQLCAQMMHTAPPWVTLGFDLQQCIGAFKGIGETYVLTIDKEIAGFAILQLKGAFSGYIQSICIGEQYRNRKLGEALIKFCEDKIFNNTPNVFLCVSSFNDGAEQFYYRNGYEKVGVLKDHLVRGYDEYLLRKTLGPRMEFTILS